MGDKKRKILLVEDEAVVRESVQDWLVEDGYDVECVETGEEALERIKKEEYGVIVLDLRLPGIDGLQVYEHVKVITPETKGVIITAYPSDETLEKAKRLGIVDYLPKPFRVEDLENIISSALIELEEKKIDKKDLWLELGAVSYRLCTHGYECGCCELAREMKDTLGAIAVIGGEKAARIKELRGSQILCRYASVHFVKKEKPHLGQDWSGFLELLEYGERP